MKLLKHQALDKMIFQHSEYSTDNYGVSDALMNFLCGGASWTLDPHNSMNLRKSRKCPPWFVGIQLHPSTMC